MTPLILIQMSNGATPAFKPLWAQGSNKIVRPITS